MKSLLPRVFGRWQRLSYSTKHWIQNVTVGVALAALFQFGLHFEISYLVSVQNLAFDKIMELHSALDVPERIGRTIPKQTFVDIDEATYRSQEWAGGEPPIAPRDKLLLLIDKAFALGATQVVLDVAVETREKPLPAELAMDQQFADGLRSLLERPYFGLGRQLILVRSVRSPLPQLLLDAKLPMLSTRITYPAFGEAKQAPALDSLILESSTMGRIGIAAPYFRYSNDRFLRDWEIFEVLCQRVETASELGRLHIVPSVQLLVRLHQLGLSHTDFPITEPRGCSPFPILAESVRLDKHELERLRGQLKQFQAKVRFAYWEQVQTKLSSVAISRSDSTHANDFVLGDLGRKDSESSNRIVFRYSPDALKTNSLINVIPGIALLRDKLPTDLFKNQVVVIGQTHSLAADVHQTTLGPMPGAFVLINAIDSMARYPLIRTPSAWTTTPVSIGFFLVVGYVFSRWSKMAATVISTAIGLIALSAVSFKLFSYGIWMDFSLPFLGIQLFNLIKDYHDKQSKKSSRKRR